MGSAGSAPAREPQLCQVSRDSSQPLAPTSRSQAPTHSAHSWHSRHRGAPHLPEREAGKVPAGRLMDPRHGPKAGMAGQERLCSGDTANLSPWAACHLPGAVPVALLVLCHTSLLRRDGCEWGKFSFFRSDPAPCRGWEQRVTRGDTTESGLCKGSAPSSSQGRDQRRLRAGPGGSPAPNPSVSHPTAPAAARGGGLGARKCAEWPKAFPSGWSQAWH